jgi:hypothetical protein
LFVFCNLPRLLDLTYVLERCDEIQERGERDGIRNLAAKDKVHTPLHASIQ